MLKDRQKSILDAVVREYIKTAKPVASKELAKEFPLEISSATIRNEMLKLDTSGYLEQPYISAGRIPTDKGYRFFVDHLTPEASLNIKEEELLDEVFGVRAEDEFVKEFGKIISRISGIFTAVGMFEDDIFYETGFSELLEEPEFGEPAYMKAFGQMLDLLDEKIAVLVEKRSIRDGEIFIGGENPLKEARAYSMIVASWKHPRGFSGFFTMIGPKRTNYYQHKAILRSVGARKNHER